MVTLKPFTSRVGVQTLHLAWVRLSTPCCHTRKGGFSPVGGANGPSRLGAEVCRGLCLSRRLGVATGVALIRRPARLFCFLAFSFFSPPLRLRGMYYLYNFRVLTWHFVITYLSFSLRTAKRSRRHLSAEKQTRVGIFLVVPQTGLRIHRAKAVGCLSRARGLFTQSGGGAVYTEFCVYTEPQCKQSSVYTERERSTVYAEREGCLLHRAGGGAVYTEVCVNTELCVHRVRWAVSQSCFHTTRRSVSFAELFTQVCA